MTARQQSARKWFTEGITTGVRPAGSAPRWARCVAHRDEDVEAFVRDYFGRTDRRVLLIGGAGFDPRSLVVARLLANVAGSRIDGVFLRERRPQPAPELRERADANITELKSLIAKLDVHDIAVFDDDGAVTVGRHVVDAMQQLVLDEYTDVVLDFSALSIGSSFPLARLLLERIDTARQAGAAGKGPTNLHAMVTASPTTDDRISPSPSPVVQPIHGFRGRWKQDDEEQAARLWMPQLRFRQRPILERLYEEIVPHDVVPVLPFPARDPRAADRLIEHYAEEFEGRWGVDARSLVYADERSPLDFYKTVLRIHDGRHPVFMSTGGSLLILSPVGSKVLAIGAMMAAVERDLPVLYVEALSYAVEFPTAEQYQYSNQDLVHVWLTGDAYPPPAVPPGTTN